MGKRWEPFQAVAICEGFEQADEETTLEAWQFLIDTGLAWNLQGTFGRMAMDLIKCGLCSHPEDGQGGLIRA